MSSSWSMQVKPEDAERDSLLGSSEQTPQRWSTAKEYLHRSPLLRVAGLIAGVMLVSNAFGSEVNPPTPEALFQLGTTVSMPTSGATLLKRASSGQKYRTRRAVATRASNNAPLTTAKPKKQYLYISEPGDSIDYSGELGSFDDVLFSSIDTQDDGEAFLAESKKAGNDLDFSDLNLDKTSLTLMWFFAPLTLFAQEAAAKGGEFGIYESKSVALVHPAMMFGLLILSLFTAVSGFQFRRLRDVGKEIKDLNAQLPVLSSGEKAKYPLKSQTTELQNEIDAATDEKVKSALQNDVAKIAAFTKLMDYDSEYLKLTTEKKELAGKNLRDEHWNGGSWLLGAGTFFALFGPLNTFLRTGRLFPGPHLYAGLGMVAIWAGAAALIPQMQKGNEAARYGHIVLNCTNVVLFLWQTGTGIEIVFKVLGAEIPWF